MMAFITLTISFTVAILLSGVIGFIVMTNPKVMKWYVKYVMKCMNNFDESLDDATEGL